MLFDLRGKRRRAVQATYVTLAVLIGGGLVLFGIGGGVSGGLLDALRGGGGSSGGGSVYQKRVDRDQRALRRNPRDEAALRDLARSQYQLVAQDADPNTGAFPKKDHDDLQKVASAWERYLALNPPRPDASLAGLMVQVYAPGALNRPAKAAKAAEILAAANPTANAYLTLVQYATLAGQTRTADLAAQRALDLAPKGQRANVKAAIKQARRLSPQGTG
jgi:hypothetical protein